MKAKYRQDSLGALNIFPTGNETRYIPVCFCGTLGLLGLRTCQRVNRHEVRVAVGDLGVRDGAGELLPDAGVLLEGPQGGSKDRADGGPLTNIDNPKKIVFTNKTF